MDFRYLLILGAAALGIASCSPETPKAFLRPIPPDEKVVQDNNNIQYFDPRVDILFVVDNSGSMGTHQANLAANVTQFTSTFTKSSVLDYNIGIVTTDMDNYGGNDCCGRLTGSPRIVNKATPNADTALANNFLVGTSGSAIEASFDPVVSALSSPNVTGWNVGFYRPDATFVVIFITDASDQSRTTTDPRDLYKFLLNLKGGNAKKILAYGVIVPSGDSTCPRDSGNPVTTEAFLGMVQNGVGGKNIMNICDPDYGLKLANMAKDIVDKVGNVIYLDRPAALESIRVTYGSIDLPKDFETGWSFDPNKNAIILGSKVDWNSQPSGSKVKVFYSAAKFK